MVFIDEESHLQRRPDVAFLGIDRWNFAQEFPEIGQLQVVPTIAVEVASPNDLVRDVLHKTHEYLKFGVEEIWLIFPEEQILYRYRSQQSLQVLNKQDTLTTEGVLPGFSLSMSELFRRTAPIGHFRQHL